MSGAAPSGGADHPFLAEAAIAPELLDWWTGSFAPTLFEGGGRVPGRMKQLLRLRLEQLHGVRYPGLGDPLAAGVTAGELAAIGGPLDDLPATVAPGERAVLELAGEMELSNMEGYLDQAMYDRLKAHWTDGAIFEIGHTTAVLCGYAKFLRVYGLQG